MRLVSIGDMALFIIYAFQFLKISFFNVCPLGTQKGFSQAAKGYSTMDLGQDSSVSCLHCHQSFCSRSIRTFQTSGEVFCLETFVSPSWS